MTESQHHRIDYLEFGSADLAASRAFFSTVFAWRFTDYGPQYTAFHDGRIDGGFDATRAPSEAGPLIVLYANSLETCLAAVQEAGAEIVKPIFNFPGGKRFHFREPGGNQLAVWSE